MGIRCRSALASLLLFILLPFGVSAQSTAQSPAQTIAALYQRGQSFMTEEDWYSAVETFLEVLRHNDAHAGSARSLAECYYELAEFDQALTWTRRARVLARNDISLANLESSTLIALGRLDEAQIVINEVLVREPNNREALFAAAELDIARGRSGEAVSRYREAVRRFPDDRRLLVSLALVSGALGDTDSAIAYINRALLLHEGDFRVHYYAAHLASRQGRIAEGILHAENALYYRPNYAEALSLLASLRYRAGEYEEAARLADALIAIQRENSLAWYLKGMAFIRMGRFAEAQTMLETALGLDEHNEFTRAALEDLLLTRTRIEDQARRPWALWHFNRARIFRTQNLTGEALFHYRRGLRLNPDAAERRDYAELLRLQNYPARFLEELRFIQARGTPDRALDDAVESYNHLLMTALSRLWNVDPIAVSKPHWNVAVFSLASSAASGHVDASGVAASFMRDILIHERNIRPVLLELRQPSFAAAFRTAREGGADYFLVVSVSENARDLLITGDLFVSRTGAQAASFSFFRAGQDRLRLASRGIVNQLASALPFRAELLQRRQNQGLIDKGRADGVQVGNEFLIVKRESLELASSGIGFIYSTDDIVGRFTVTTADEEIALGTLTQNGFFDRIEAGDRIIPVPEPSAATPESSAAPAIDPELRSLLRRLR